MASRTILISVDLIDWPEIRVSAKYDEETRRCLEATIQKLGVIQDIVVRPKPAGRYEGIAGKHRFEELVKQGAREISCKVVDADDKTSSMMNIVENIARGTFDPMEVSRSLNQALDRGATIQDLTEYSGHTQDWVERYLRLTKLPQVYQDALSQGKLKIGHLDEALSLPTPEEADEALRAAVTFDWKVETMKHYVENRLAELARHEKMKQEGIVEGPPPQAQPQELVRVRKCLVCSRMVKAEQTSLPTTCEECYTMGRYIASQVGTGEEAMNLIYQALTVYQQYQQAERIRRIREQEEAQARGGQAPPPGS